ncbi:hypothetical protein GPECTOR_66g248 [Gonium pectorale]|uniref:Uncharacterized protein n=1 Tax=Gonium pectorale TaxID=33097 RepID=A0A150G5C2_GONPE|nr:hypothetical protein GPECTOR_66g248 [Gonium pectorale]|eukprot:KXZ44520.1 hypothetical protein GPECTOR_66g248 [Gonium pectorale]
MSMSPQDGWTALHVACKLGDEEVVKLLLHKGADPSVRDLDQGFTPMHVAAMNGHWGLVKTLLWLGADPTAKTKSLLTPYDVAIGDTTKLLLLDAMRAAECIPAVSERRCKVMLLGPGAAGKTTLVRRLLHSTFMPDLPATHGVEVWDWTPAQQPEPGCGGASGQDSARISFSLWDLGGQVR